MQADNCTRNDVTDFSLHYLMFGRKPCLSIDITFGTNTAELKVNTSTEYVKNCKQRLGWVYKTVNKVVKREQEWNKQHYNQKVRGTLLKVGDKVLLKCTAFKGKYRVQDRWEDAIYEVIEQAVGKMPDFKIKSSGKCYDLIDSIISWI